MDIFTKNRGQVWLMQPDSGALRWIPDAEIIHWMASGEDVFYPSSGVFDFPLARQEDAPFEVLFFIPPRPIRVGRSWAIHELSDLEDLEFFDEEDD